MPYDVGKDYYVDPVTGVLTNKLGITDRQELEDAEAEITSVKIISILVGADYDLGQFTWQLLLSIHARIFDEIYDWAGEVRDVEISKGDTSFARMEHINSSGEALLSELANEHYLEGLDDQQVLRRLAHYYSELNIIHPFREGNGRTIRTYISLLAETLGWDIAWDEMDPEENITACIAAYNGNEQPLVELFFRVSDAIDPFWLTN